MSIGFWLLSYSDLRNRFYHLISPAAPYSANLLITTPFWAMLWIVTPLCILAWALSHLGLLMLFFAEYLFILLTLVFWLYCSPGISTFYRCCLCFAEVSSRMILGHFYRYWSVEWGIFNRVEIFKSWVEENYSIGFPAIGNIWKCKYTPTHTHIIIIFDIV